MTKARVTQPTLSWQHILLLIHHNHVDPLSEGLTELGAHAVSLTPAHDANHIGSTEQLQLSALFPIEVDCAAVLQTLQAQGILTPGTQAMIKPLADKDWVRETQRNWRAFSVDDALWVVPSWETPPRADKPHINIDPGASFGCGTHPTTQLCLQWLTTQSLADKTIVDLGSGSGILSFAAAALNAKHVYAYDKCADARSAMQHNKTLNATLAPRITLCDSADELPKTKVVIANMLTKSLLACQALLCDRTDSDGQLVLSGLIDINIADITAAYTPHMTLTDLTQQDSWYRMVWEHKKSA